MTETSDRELRAVLESTQARVKQLEAQLQVADELRAQVQASKAEVAALQEERGLLRSRLDQADQVRVEWTRKQEILQHGLRVAQEQARLRRVIDNLEAELALVRRG